MLINIKKLINDVSTDWKLILLSIYRSNRDKMKALEKCINEDYEKYGGYFNIFPPPNLIFNSFNYFEFEDLKVVIIGQDPYHGEGQAMGLSFSVPMGSPVPPSLINIYKEIKDNYSDFEIPKHGDLTKWAEQGVLLLNATLTVREKDANSHQTYWSSAGFTDDIIRFISEYGDNIIFVLWGGFAKQKKKLIDTKKHYVIEGGHPSPLSQKYWFGCGHFKKINQILEEEIGSDPINWQV